MYLCLTRPTPQGGVRLAIAGEVDLSTARALRAAIQDVLCDERVTELVVDLGQVTFLDCAGIGALVAGYNTAVTRGRSYAVINPRRHVRRVLNITGVLAALSHQCRQAPSTRHLARSS
ncbi:STAS domain-containing protein [Micromonospora sp. CPCC 206061]|uniref:STAS domain-containing protein n=1 Tax=Micromonospora sp. CPCC 206061 TaxID=3122410 RepID=UPI002FF1A9FE